MQQNYYYNRSSQIPPPALPPPIAPNRIPQQPQLVPYVQTEMEKQTGQQFNKIILITIAFVVLSNSYKVFDNIYFMFTQKQFELLNQETLKPTMTGYIVVTGIFFCIAFYIFNML